MVRKRPRVVLAHAYLLLCDVCMLVMLFLFADPDSVSFAENYYLGLPS